MTFQRKLRENLLGRVNGKLTAFSEMPGDKWICQCSCGREHVVTYQNFFVTKSCGECRGKTRGNTKHGAAFKDTGKRIGTYRSWQALRRRVYGEKHELPSYAHVTLDPRWEDFAAFLEDMGQRPDGMTIDRIDNDLGHSKENCRWATPTQQTRNRRISLVFEWKGETLPIAEWAKRLGITYHTAYDLIRNRNSLEISVC